MNGPVWQGTLFRLLVENVKDYAIFITDPQGRVQTWSDGAEGLLGYTEQEALGQPMAIFFVPDEIEAGIPQKELQQALAAGRAEDDRWHVHKNGSRFWTSGVTTPLWDEKQNLRGFAKIIRDRTDWKRADDARKESEARKAAVLETSLDGIITIDQNDQIIEFSPASERLFGYRRTDVLGRKMADIIIPERLREAHMRGMARYLATGEGPVLNRRIKLSAVRADGTEFPVEVAITRVPGDGPPLFTGYIRDITEREQQEQRRAAQLVITEVLASAVTVHDAACRILQAICENLGWDLGGFWLVDRQAGVARCLDIWHAPELQVNSFARISRECLFSWGQGLPGRVWSTGQPLWLPDVNLDNNFPRLALAAESGLHAAFAVPVLLGTDVLGVIEFFSRSIRQPDAGLLGMMATIGGHFGQFIERKESQEWLKTLIDNLPDGAIYQAVQKADGLSTRFTYLSAGVERIFGVKPLDAVRDAAALYGTVYEDDRDRLQAAEAEALRSLSPFDCTFRHRTPSGEVRWVHCRSAPRQMETGERVWEGVIIDVTDRQRAEEAQRASEALLRFTLNATQVGHWDLNLSSDTAERSLRHDQIFGYDSLVPNWGYRIFQKHVHPDDFFEVDRRYQEAVTSQKDFEFECRIIRADGALRWIWAKGSVYLADSDQARRMAGLLMDITDRKQAQEQLEDSEQRFRQLAENIANVFYIADAIEPKLLYISPAYERVWGRTCQSLYADSRSFLDAVHPDDRERVLNAFDQQRQGVETAQEYRIVRPDGSTRWIWDRAFPVRDASGKVARVAGLAEDITERKRVENDLRFLSDASRSLSSLVDYESTLQRVAQLAVPAFADWCSVHMADENGTLRQLAVAHIDPSKVEIARMLGRHYAPDPNAPVGSAHVFRTGQSERVEEIADELLSSVAQDDEHLRILRELGLKSYICVPLAVREKIIGVLTFVGAESGRRYTLADLALAEDLARRAAIAVENARLYSEIREADRRKDEFLAMLAHELRNPLAPIRSGLDLLGLIGTDNEIIEPMQQQVEHLVRLVDDLLDVSRIMQGKVELRREPVKLSTVVARAVDTVRPMIDGNQQTLSVKLPSEPIWLGADPVRLAQVISNLLNNASKYSENGSQISLAADRHDNELILRVCDTGIGIDPDLLPHVFDLFTQATRTIDRSQGGLGIGLTVVKSLVEMHGGQVSVYSHGPGEGTEFTVRLPILHHAEQRSTDRENPVATSEYRILVVDDNVAAAKMLGLLLQRLGNHHLYMAYDGLEALESAKQNQPDLILLDIGLPKLDGYEVVRQLRQSPEFKRTLVVALTGYGTEEDRRKSLHAGFDEHLVKPPGVEALQKLLIHPKLITH